MKEDEAGRGDLSAWSREKGVTTAKKKRLLSSPFLLNGNKNITLSAGRTRTTTTTTKRSDDHEAKRLICSSSN